MTFLESLRGNRLLRGCAEDVLASIEPLVRPVDVPRGEVIFRRGEPADAMYLIFGGIVHLTRQPPGTNGPELLAQIGADDFFGDMALLDHEPHVVDAVAAETATLGRIDRPGMEENPAPGPARCAAQLRARGSSAGHGGEPALHGGNPAGRAAPPHRHDDGRDHPRLQDAADGDPLRVRPAGNPGSTTRRTGGWRRSSSGRSSG